MLDVPLALTLRGSLALRLLVPHGAAAPGALDDDDPLIRPVSGDVLPAARHPAYRAGSQLAPAVGASTQRPFTQAHESPSQSQ